MNAQQSVTILIGALKNDFAAAWRDGKRPRMENYLEGAPDASKLALFRELLLVEMRYLSAAQEALEVCEYTARFPEFTSIIFEAFEESAGSAPTTVFLDPPVLSQSQRERLGDYRLFERLGQGGMGIVYRAEHVRLKKMVAIKVMRTDKHDQKSIARFQKELVAVGKLDHPNIVRASDAGEVDGIHYLVMEYVHGIDLYQLVQYQGPLPIDVACHIIWQAAMGLQHVHEHGLVHRDIKPSNLMLSISGQIKLLDLGLARLTVESVHSGELTKAGQVLGSVDYMAPEQVDDVRSVDIRSDIYSLGCTFFHLLNATPPYGNGQPGSIVKKLMAHAEAPIPVITEKRPELPAEIGPIVTRMLAKKAAQRYPAPSVVADILKPYILPTSGVSCLRLVRETLSAREAASDESDGADQESAPDSPSRHTVDRWSAQTDTSQKSLFPHVSIPSPYPGLRPFTRDESDRFFGREEQVEQLLEKLGRHRFLAVVGPSGCGKSSLVLAGLMPMLRGGFIEGVGPHWREAVMRPGEAPFERLSMALLDKQALGEARGEGALAAGTLEATLRRGPWGLVDALNETGLPAGTNLVLLIDQFEEIFRYRELCSSGGHPANDAEAFVNMLLAATTDAAQNDERLGSVAVYVVITMRWDFLDDHFHFTGLTDALNRSVFFTPRLTRDQAQAAIAGPARSLNSDIEPVLVNRLLNDTATDPDQLPLIQHTLMRMWNEASRKIQPTGPEPVPPRLSLADYQELGSADLGLSTHADEQFARCNGRQQRIARKMFQWLCERGTGLRDTRRPITLGEVARVAMATIEEVSAVVDIFRSPDTSFIMPPADISLAEETILDISHECLIRKWERLKSWVAEETENADRYRQMLSTARRWRRDGQLWPYADLDWALQWKESEDATAAWADRYGGDLELALEFVAASGQQRDEGAAVRRRKYEFDVFLGHVMEDKEAVRRIADRLMERQLRPWFDEWDLPPGRTWEEEVSSQIDEIRSAAIFIGPRGQSPWQQMELRSLLAEFSERKRPIIPVILAGFKGELPTFLREFTLVDFRKTEPDPMQRLLWGITGERPD